MHEARAGSADDLLRPAGGLPGEIIAAAVALFSEKGYRGTSVKDILLSTNSSKGGLYHHFESKEQILVAIHDAFIDYELSTAEATLAADAAPEERLRRLLVAHMESIAAHHQHMSVFIQEERELSPAAAERIRVKRRRYQDMIDDSIQSCVDAGVFREDIHVRLQGRLLVGMMNSVVRWYRPETSDMAEIIQAILRTEVDGLRRR